MNFEKIIVAPQIVIYKNIFKHSEKLISLLANNSEDLKFSNWREWHKQGMRREVFIDREYLLEDNLKNNKEELKILTNIFNIVNFINIDYFNEFGGSKGVWPSYITDWNIFEKPIDQMYIDYFRYDLKEAKNLKKENIMMEYHVDEFVNLNEFKPKRNVITINFYLNNDYDGGEICAYDFLSKKSYKYKPNPGDVVVMPSTHPFYHAVKSYQNSDRYFLRTFIDYVINNNEYNNFDWDKIKKEEQVFVENNLQQIKVFANEEVVR